MPPGGRDIASSLRAWWDARRSVAAHHACLPDSAEADGQRLMSASHWTVVLGVMPSSFWAESSGAIDLSGSALIA